MVSRREEKVIAFIVSCVISTITSGIGILIVLLTYR